MTLQDIYDHLAHGELQQVISGDQEAQMTEQMRRKLFSPIHLGLTELHKRFLLREERAKVVVQEGRQSYVLDKAFAHSNNQATDPFIDDADRPFEGNIFKIERIEDPKGKELLLNQVDRPESLRTLSHNTILLPDEFEHEHFTAVCRADHAPINAHLVPAAPSQVQIQLPATHLWALLLFVGYRVMNPMGATGEFHEGNNYLTKFEAECHRLKAQSFEQNRDDDSPRFIQNGFV